MNLLVTGGCGFIGSNFIKYMLEKYPDYKITNLDNLSYSGDIKNLDEVKNNPNYSFIKGDICDKKIVFEAMKNVDWVINFAAQTHVDNSIKNPEIFFKTNVEGVLNLAQNARISGVKKFLQISTDEVYGSSDGKCFNEESLLNPSSPYSASKASAEMLLGAYYKTFNLPVLITRSSNNFGPNQHKEKLIPCFTDRISQGKKLPLYGDGLNKRDWIYVYDHIKALDIVLHKGTIGEIYNISSGEEKTNLEIAQIILKAFNKDESFIKFTTDRLGHDKRYFISNKKICALGWKPRAEFKEGLRKTIEWYKKG